MLIRYNPRSKDLTSFSLRLKNKAKKIEKREAVMKRRTSVIKKRRRAARSGEDARYSAMIGALTDASKRPPESISIRTKC